MPKIAWDFSRGIHDNEKCLGPPISRGAQVFNVCSAVSYFSTRGGSIIGAGRLSFRVRDGSGRFPAAMAAVTLCKFLCAPFLCAPVFGVGVFLVVGCGLCVVVVASFCGFFVSFRPVSASSLSYCYGRRSGLSIPWSAGGLIPLDG